MPLDSDYDVPSRDRMRLPATRDDVAEIRSKLAGLEKVPDAVSGTRADIVAVARAMDENDSWILIAVGAAGALSLLSFILSVVILWKVW